MMSTRSEARVMWVRAEKLPTLTNENRNGNTDDEQHLHSPVNTILQLPVLRLTAAITMR